MIAPIFTCPAEVGVGVAVGVAVSTAVGMAVSVAVSVGIGVGAGVFSFLPQANNAGVIDASKRNKTANLYQELFLYLTTTNLLLHLEEPTVRFTLYLV